MRDRDDRAADAVPQLAASDDVERAGAGVEPDEEAVRAAADVADGQLLTSGGRVHVVASRVQRRLVRVWPCRYPRPVDAAAARRSRAIC